MATNPNGPHNNYVGASFDWKANGTTHSHYNCPFCAVPYQMSQPYPCGFHCTAAKVKAICSKTNGPHNNVVGATYYSGTFGRSNCPFCGDTVGRCGFNGTGNGPGTTGTIKTICGNLGQAATAPVAIVQNVNVVGATLTNWQYKCPWCQASGSICGLLTDWADQQKRGPGESVIIRTVCSKTPVSGQPVAAASNGPKLLDPKENRIGNTVPYFGSGKCVFCGTEYGRRGACGGDGVFSHNNTLRITGVCTKVGPVTIMPPEAKKMEWVKPTVNCPACGAYCAHKHRIGCKAVVTC